jgi:hypothetical protein
LAGLSLKPREHPAQGLVGKIKAMSGCFILRPNHQLNALYAHYSRSVADASHSVELARSPSICPAKTHIEMDDHPTGILDGDRALVRLRGADVVRNNILESTRAALIDEQGRLSASALLIGLESKSSPATENWRLV